MTAPKRDLAAIFVLQFSFLENNGPKNKRNHQLRHISNVDNCMKLKY
jgi:hypothetical protein